MRKHLPYSLIGVALLAVACGQKVSPGAPSASGSVTNGSARISGRVAAGSVTSVSLVEATGSLAASGVSDTGLMASPLTASVANGQFLLQGVPAGNVQLQFSGPGTDARLSIANVQDREDIALTVRVNGASVETDDHRRTTTDSRVEIEGRVTAVNVSGGTVTIGDTVISVPAGTPVTGSSGRPLDLSAIQVGNRVEVHATLSGTTIVATRIEIESAGSSGAPNPNPGPSNPTVELKGIVSGRSGNCNTLTFAVGTVPVSTTDATRFEDGTCRDIQDGVRVEVKGSRGTNGIVVAASVEIEDDDEDDDDDDNGVELEGTLTAKTGTCPVVTLTVGTRQATANAQTRYEDVTCQTLSVPSRVEVKATRQANGTLLATKVEKK